jgi:hypothetical protein
MKRFLFVLISLILLNCSSINYIEEDNFVFFYEIPDRTLYVGNNLIDFKDLEQISGRRMGSVAIDEYTNKLWLMSFDENYENIYFCMFEDNHFDVSNEIGFQLDKRIVYNYFRIYNNKILIAKVDEDDSTNDILEIISLIFGSKTEIQTNEIKKCFPEISYATRPLAMTDDMLIFFYGYYMLETKEFIKYNFEPYRPRYIAHKKLLINLSRSGILGYYDFNKNEYFNFEITSKRSNGSYYLYLYDDFLYYS